jgi:hypothetical protein
MIKALRSPLAAKRAKIASAQLGGKSVFPLLRGKQISCQKKY